MNGAFKIPLIMFACLAGTNKINAQKESISNQLTHAMAPFRAIVEKVAHRRQVIYHMLAGDCRAQIIYIHRFEHLVKNPLEAAYGNLEMLVQNALTATGDPVAIRENHDQFRQALRTEKRLTKLYTKAITKQYCSNQELRSNHE